MSEEAILVALERQRLLLLKILEELRRACWDCGCGQVNSVLGPVCIRCGRRIGETI